MNNNYQFQFGTLWSPEHFDGEVAFGNMQRAFAEAMAKYPDEVCESFYLFGEQKVRIRIVGRQLAQQIFRPFSHLQLRQPTHATPRLRIDLWDDNRAKANANPRVQTTPAGLRWTEITAQSADARFIGQHLPHTFSCLDRETQHIIGAIAWHERIFIYERAKPLARLLLEWHNDQGMQIIHTGLVAQHGQGVLFAGKSGSGKSTTSLTCVCAGFDYLSEDYVGLERRHDGTFVGHSLYNSIFLESRHLRRFADLMPHAIKGRLPEEEKSVILLSQVFPEQLKRAVPIRALILPRVADTPVPHMRAASKGEALLALGPSSLLQIPNKGLGVQGLDKLAQLVERVPCYRLELGRDLSPIPSLVKDVIAELKDKDN